MSVCYACGNGLLVSVLHGLQFGLFHMERVGMASRGGSLGYAPYRRSLDLGLIDGNRMGMV